MSGLVEVGESLGLGKIVKEEALPGGGSLESQRCLRVPPPFSKEVLRWALQPCSVRGFVSPTKEDKRFLADICPDTVLTTALDRETDRQMVTLKWRHDGKRVWLSIYLKGPPASLLTIPWGSQGKVVLDHCRIYFRQGKDEDRP